MLIAPNYFPSTWFVICCDKGIFIINYKWKLKQKGSPKTLLITLATPLEWSTPNEFKQFKVHTLEWFSLPGR